MRTPTPLGPCRIRVVVVIAAAWCLAFTSMLLADDVPRFEILHPQPREVVQRTGFDPLKAHPHQPGGPALGHAMVPLELDLSATGLANIDDATLVCVVEPLADTKAELDSQPVGFERRGNIWSGKVRINAGGWYHLQLSVRHGEQTVARGTVGPVGVGEVFLIAGQSYAAGANDELLKIDDARERVVAYDVVKRQWQVANDPQPNVGDGGTIWPALGNDLLPLLGVPIGFVNVAVGGTASRQWLPGEELYQRLEESGKTIGQFRAVLWQQGESDVIEHRSTDDYVQNLVTIRTALAKAWVDASGFDPPWLLAKSTLHPTVYNDPAGEERIRRAIDRLWTTPGFRPGPDTDILDGENRGALGTRRHFSGIGQRRAGLMWCCAIWQELNRAP